MIRGIWREEGPIVGKIVTMPLEGHFPEYERSFAKIFLPSA
jgi:hypothetical protein